MLARHFTVICIFITAVGIVLSKMMSNLRTGNSLPGPVGVHVCR